MRPNAAIVEPVVNVDAIADRIIVARGEERQAEDAAERYQEGLASARELARQKRLEIGRMLLQARPAFGRSGPGAGWGKFLERIGIDDSTAVRYMEAARGGPSAEKPDLNPAHGEEVSRIAELALEGGAGEAVAMELLGRLDPASLARVMKQLRVNTIGNSGEEERGTWITAKKWAERVGPWDLDPFTNPRSHIVAGARCMLEDGGDGLANPAEPGSYRCGPGSAWNVATAGHRVWGQPPYNIVEEAVSHYRHTRFCFLLRFDPSTAWFAALWECTQLLAIPLGDREMFEPPPGIKASSNPHAHAFYYADPRDITPAIRETCIVLTRYEAQQRPELHIVR